MTVLYENPHDGNFILSEDDEAGCRATTSSLPRAPASSGPEPCSASLPRVAKTAINKSPGRYALSCGDTVIGGVILFPQRAESKGAGLPEERRGRVVFPGRSM